MNTRFPILLQWKRLLSVLLPHSVLSAQPRDEQNTWRSRGGSLITLRAAKKSDATLIQSLVRSLSTQSRYHRFFFPLQELTPELLKRFVRADVTRDITLLATIPDGDQEVAVAMGQYAVGGDAYRAEFAVLVADAWQREGIGSHMLDALTWVAQAAGIERLEGDVLAENDAMLALMERKGFSVRTHPDGAHVIRASKRLAPEPRACPQLIEVVRRARLRAEQKRLHAA